MEVVRLLLAFTAGVLSPLSPCSLPLLSSYIAYYLSAVETERLRDALILASTTLLGFLSVYILISIAPSLVLGAIPLSLKVLNLLLGVILLLLGLAIFLRGSLTLFLLPLQPHLRLGAYYPSIFSAWSMPPPPSAAPSQSSSSSSLPQLAQACMERCPSSHPTRWGVEPSFFLSP
jgi:cytochrome c biogenesis protein CcdA